MSVGDFVIRSDSRADGESLTALYLRSRTAAMPWLAGPHDEAATRWWMEHNVIGGLVVAGPNEPARWHVTFTVAEP